MSKKIMSAGGLGESKPFVAPEGDPIREPRPNLTIGGVPLSELPPEIRCVIPFENTDQGLEAKEAQPKAYTQVVRDEFDKTVAGRREALADGVPTFMAPDPMRDVAAKHTPPGFRAKFLSPMKTTREGTRGFQVVKDERGDPVKLGNMPLGVIPEEVAQKRNEHYRAMGAEQQKQIVQDYQEQQAKTLRDAGLRPSSALSRPSDGDVGFQSVRGNQME